MNTTLQNLNRSLETDTSARAWLKVAKHHAARGASEFGSLPELTDPAVEVIQKAAVTALATGNETPLKRTSIAYLDVAERDTILRRLVGTVPAPPYTNLAALAGDPPSAAWVADGAAIPVARMSLAAPTTSIGKFAFIIAFSKELARSTDDRATSLFERILTRALRHTEDRLLLADDDAVAQERPAGLLHGLSAVGSGSPASLLDDIEGLWLAVRNGDPIRPHYIASPRGLMYLATRREDGAPLFPDVGPLGGTLLGVPVIPSAAAAEKLILVDAAQIAVVDEGAITESAQHASIEMSDAPTSNVTGPNVAAMVSAFQTDAVFLRLIRYLSWTKLRGDAVAYVSLPTLSGSPW